MADILQPPGRPISYHPELTKLVGTVKAAILVQQISYWTPRAHDADGWIYKSERAWMEETGFSLKELRGAMDELLTRKFIRREYDRRRHELRVQLQVDAYNAAIQGLCEQRPKEHVPKRHVPKEHMPKGNVAHAKREPATCQKGTCPNNVVTRDDPEITPEITPPENANAFSPPPGVSDAPARPSATRGRRRNPETEGTRLSRPWQPGPSVYEWFTTKRYDQWLDWEETLTEFCNYWWALPDSNKKPVPYKLDWDGTLQNRIITLVKDLKGRQARASPRHPVSSGCVGYPQKGEAPRNCDACGRSHFAPT